MKALILINAYGKPQASVWQAERLREEFERCNVSCQIRRNDRFAVYSDGATLKTRVEEFDFCIYLDKDKYISQMLERTGMRVFNRHEAIRICDDKMETQIALAGSGVTMPAAIAGTLCYDPSDAIAPHFAQEAERILGGYPIVVKTSYGSLGKGVWLAQNRAELTDAAERVKGIPHLFQAAVTESLGKDLRVIVIGGKALCQMQRIARDDFRSNIELGGIGRPCDLPDDFRDAAQKAAVRLGLDYCGVDLLWGKDGKPIVCEVNSNAFFQSMERVSGVNVARAYARYAIERMEEERCASRR